MRGLFFKIFIIFWIAQSLIFVISTALILHRRFPPPFLWPALSSTICGWIPAMPFPPLKRAAVPALIPTRGSTRERIGLTRQQRNRPLLFRTEVRLPACTPAPRATFPESSRQQLYLGRSRDLRFRQKLHVPPQCPGGPGGNTPGTDDLLHFAFPQCRLPSPWAELTTFALVLIFTRPVIRLRKAARQLAQGNLQHARRGECLPRSGIF